MQPDKLDYSRIDTYSPGHPGCWRWNGSHHAKGYAVFWRRDETGRRRKHYVHRELYREFVGEPRFTLDHVCNNTGCVNPCHLADVTAEENSRRAAAVRRRKTETAQ